MKESLAAHDVRGAVSAYEADPTLELDDLQRIAEHVLIEGARSSNDADSARTWALLGGMGRAAEAAWSALERDPGDHHAPLVRAHALAWRSKLGEAPAQRELAIIEEEARPSSGASVDPEVLALAIGVLDPERDVEALRTWARSTAVSVRSAAVQGLARAPESNETRVVLVELARGEPDESVRAQALRALATQGRKTWPSLEALAREAATDAVRAAALAGLRQLDTSRAVPLLAAVLSDAPSMLGVDVAQDVLSAAQRGQRADSLEATAEQQILAALGAPKPDLRARAASAALAVASGPDRAALRAELLVRMAAERDRRVHVLIALALRAEPEAHKALEELALGRDVPAAQAAAELAARRDAAGWPRLRELAKSKDTSIRATASAALASTYEFAAVRTARPASVEALLDPDARVRITAAAAVLRAIERMRAQL